MKKLFIIIVCLGCFGTIYGQSAPKMELKHNGFVGGDSTKNFTVIEAPGMKKNELFKKVLTYLNSQYKNPQKVITSVENESIVVNGYTDQIKGDLKWYVYDVNYNIVMNFKDGKLRFEPRIVEFKENWSESKPARQYYINSAQSSTPSEINCIWLGKKDGSFFLFQPTLKVNFDKWVNNYISGIAKSIGEDW